MNQLQTAVAVLLERQNNYSTAEAYYDGTVDEVFTSLRLRRILGGNSRFLINFCRPVVDSVLDRLEINAVSGTTQDAQKAINRVFEQNELALEIDEIHRRALVYGDCYAVVWPDEAGELQISYNSPRNMVLMYDPENPRKKLFAAKMWTVANDNGSASTRLNLYWADRIVKYSAPGDLVTEKTPFAVIDSVDNPFGEVPVFHFRTHRPYGRPEHVDAFPVQDLINKFVVTHAYTVDYQGAPQRYALSTAGANAEVDDFNDNDTDRENVGALKNGPGELWYLKGIDKVGQFAPADYKVFTEPVKDFIRQLASITHTPLHYFERTGNVPSGEALRTAEAPLLKKVKDRQQAFAAAWRDLFRFVLRVEGIKADVQVKWAEVESMDSLSQWDVMLKKINAGLSHRQALREGGYDDELIDKIMAEREEEAKNGNFYQRKPQVRVSTEDNETFEADAA